MPDCSRGSQARGWCALHYKRWQASGDPGTSERRHRPDGAGYLRSDGYIIVACRGHALANNKDRAYGHRVALYDEIGPGSHPCHWCGSLSSWDDGLTADHLDWDRSNNDPENLVPSCLECNSRRFQERTDIGETNPMSVLTETQVLEIRAKYRPGVTYRALAAQYGVHFMTIASVIRRKTWRHI